MTMHRSSWITGEIWGPSRSSGGETSGCGGRRSRFERARTRDFPTGNSSSLLFSLRLDGFQAFASHAWCHKGTATRPLPTEPWRFPVIPRRTRSSYLCVVVGLLVHVWCECGVRVWGVRACVYEQMLQLYPDERRSKKRRGGAENQL